MYGCLHSIVCKHLKGVGASLPYSMLACIHVYRISYDLWVACVHVLADFLIAGCSW